MLRTIVVDDHPVFRAYFVAALAETPDITVVQALSHARDLPATLRKTACEVLVLDLLMPGIFDPLANLRNIRQDYPTLKILVVSALEHGPYLPLIMAFVDGYLGKSDPLTLHLPAAIRRMLAGERLVSASVQPWLDHHLATWLPKLDDQDLALLHLMAKGYENEAIAQARGLSEKTVRNLISMLYYKLQLPDAPGLNKRVLAVNYARQLGLLKNTGRLALD
jgi:DNA-binding NarL/FixJ family response regulator